MMQSIDPSHKGGFFYLGFNQTAPAQTINQGKIFNKGNEYPTIVKSKAPCFIPLPLPPIGLSRISLYAVYIVKIMMREIPKRII
jgi:hypothetical protein